MGAIVRAAFGAAVIACFNAVVGSAVAQSPSSYDLTYRLRNGVSETIYAQMNAKPPDIGRLPAGATGIQLRWCRPEIPFGAWQFGTLKQQLKLLDERWCEVSYEGKIGNMLGSTLAPE